MENKIFKLTDDGWFTFWVCRVCGKKIQLTIDSEPLPDECPYCNASTTNTNSRKDGYYEID